MANIATKKIQTLQSQIQKETKTTKKKNLLDHQFSSTLQPMKSESVESILTRKVNNFLDQTIESATNKHFLL
jgi:uncharacterized protein YaaW (UPF0174 family)